MADNNFYSLDGPLESMPSERQMRIANLSGFSDLVRHHGGDPRGILERHDIDPRVLRDPDHYVDCTSVVNVLEHCSSSLNNPLFGMILAEHQEPDIYGCVTALCRAASTMREAVNSFIDYIPVTHSPATCLELVEGSDIAELRWWVRTDVGMNKQANLQATMLNIKLLSQIGGAAFKPSYVNLSVDARSRDIYELERHLGCRFHSTATENAIAFPVELLDRRVATSSRLVYKLLGGYLDRVKDASRHSVIERVEDYIRGTLASNNCSIERCAEKLGVSVRTLQARLSEADKSFSDLLEEQRVSLAKTYLKLDHFSLDDVAANLGYSEQSSFGRAFKRWTGITPKQFRRQVHN